MDVLEAIKNLKVDLRKKYGNVLRFVYSQHETHLTHYCSDVLEENGMPHNGYYLWDQKALNAAFVAGYRVGKMDSDTGKAEINNFLVDELQEFLSGLRMHT